MRAWTRGERIGFFSLVVALVTCGAVVFSLPAVQRALRGEASAGAAVTPGAEAGPDAAPPPGSEAAVLEEQRQLLAEQTLAARQEVERLHEARMELWKERQKTLEERFTGAKERAYDRVFLRNNCSAPIQVAMYYRALDDSWVTRGWWSVAPGETRQTDVATRNQLLYFYAESGEIKWTWDGAGHAEWLERMFTDAKFDHRQGDRWV